MRGVLEGVVFEGAVFEGVGVELVVSDIVCVCVCVCKRVCGSVGMGILGFALALAYWCTCIVHGI